MTNWDRELFPRGWLYRLAPYSHPLYLYKCLFGDLKSLIRFLSEKYFATRIKQQPGQQPTQLQQQQQQLATTATTTTTVTNTTTSSISITQQQQQQQQHQQQQQAQRAALQFQQDQLTQQAGLSLQKLQSQVQIPAQVGNIVANKGEHGNTLDQLAKVNYLSHRFIALGSAQVLRGQKSGFQNVLNDGEMLSSD